MLIPQFEERFDRADLIQMFRLTHNLFPEKWKTFVYLVKEDDYVGMNLKLRRLHFLTNRAFENWNTLPSLVIVHFNYFWNFRVFSG
jgi:hypothetical protein